MKLKHNKLRNPAILFELLVRQITTDTLNNRESKSVDILKKHYNNTQIAKEFKIYKSLYEAKNLSETKAAILINSAIQAYSKLNKTALRKAKYELVADIKDNYNLDESLTVLLTTWLQYTKVMLPEQTNRIFRMDMTKKKRIQ